VAEVIMMPNMKKLIGIGMVLAAGLLGGCAAAPSGASGNAGTSGTPVLASSKGQHAECLVCKYNADLACVDLKVDADTPTYSYDGKTYYFCSDTCQKKFEKEPVKYIKQK
jgi:YHS domain-containing protein